MSTLVLVAIFDAIADLVEAPREAVWECGSLLPLLAWSGSHARKKAPASRAQSKR